MSASRRAFLVASFATVAVLVGATFAADRLGAFNVGYWPWPLRVLLWMSFGVLASEVGDHFEQRAERRASADRETPP